ncbi:hypothetical protein LCGC14_2811330 [marine sediment metagenome]|uniref:Uncharacterized protein n=1 Tax=marine sediment metagenome TaxID=412755 RepID=A0A0F9AT68_9ZZZZ
MSNIKLLSCPFCGSNKIRSALNQPEAFIECSLCDCAMERYGGKDLAAVWNTRVDRWIPVSEGLPEDDDIVDVIAEIKKRTETKKTIRRICDIRWSTIETYPGSYTFTHWRNITLPKGE